MHRRRKRKNRSDVGGSQYVAEEDDAGTEHRIIVSPENRIDYEGPSIVISDSDDVKLEEERIVPKKRSSHRKLVKTKISYMTEEEQLALAVKISQQEQANHVKYRQEKEDGLLKKAIEESLHGCRAPDISTSVTAHGLTNETLSSKEYTALEKPNEELPLSQLSTHSCESLSKSPMVLLKRLSQDIVESPSVILSPNGKDPVSCIENCKPSPLSPSSSIDFVSMSPAKAVALSPVFPVKSPCPRRLLHCRLFQDNSPSVVTLPDEIDDQCSHCSESSQLDSTSVLPTSNQSEFSKVDHSPQKEEMCRKKSCNDNATRSENKDIVTVDGLESSTCRGAGKGQQNEGTVHYYWGVPFCPKGEDPSEYTQVILCQLEVYQKSLKRTQRQLLHKADYGQPIQLSASCSEHLKGDKQGSCSQEDTEEIMDDCDMHKSGESEREHAEDSDSSETQHASRKRQKVFQSPVHKLQEDDCSSPSQVESNHSQSTQELFTEVVPGECAGVTPVALAESAGSTTAVRNDRHLMDDTDDALEEEITICPETQPSPGRKSDFDKEESPDLTEPTPVPQTCFSSGAAEDIVCLEQICHKNMECPICGCKFPRAQIERHAAYCDGTNDQQEMAVLRPRPKLLRSHAGSSDPVPSSDFGKYEKCYLCKSLVPLRDYQEHVDNCLQTAVLETQGSQRLRSIKESAGRDGRLLSMLEQSESISAEASSNAPEPSYMSPPREEHSGSFISEHLNLRDSPIRSFVSISEATDCLVDFKKQFSRQPNRKGPSHRGRRKRRRM